MHLQQLKHCEGSFQYVLHVKRYEMIQVFGMKLNTIYKNIQMRNLHMVYVPIVKPNYMEIFYISSHFSKVSNRKVSFWLTHHYPSHRSSSLYVILFSMKYEIASFVNPDRKKTSRVNFSRFSIFCNFAAFVVKCTASSRLKLVASLFLISHIREYSTS